MNNANQTSSTQKIVLAALLAALTCVTTMLVKVPSPLKGYLNLGDCVVLLAGWTLSPVYGLLAAGLGSALADLFSGYVIYAPATFAIKGLMALAAYYGYRWLHKRVGALPAELLSAIVAELLMIGGYFLFEGILYGYGAAVVNIPANAVQGAAGAILGLLLIKGFEKSKRLL